MKVDQFKKHQRVMYYMPFSDVGYGVVSSVNDKFVFVKFDMFWLCLIDGDANFTAQACDPENLTLI